MSRCGKMVPVPRLCTPVDYSTGTGTYLLALEGKQQWLYCTHTEDIDTQGIKTGVTQTKGWEDVTEELGVHGGRGWKKVRCVTYWQAGLWIQHFKWIRIRIQGFDDQKFQKNTADIFLKNCKKGLHKGREKPSALKREHPALQKMKFINCFLFVWVYFCPLRSLRIKNQDPDADPGIPLKPDPDPHCLPAVLRIRIRDPGTGAFLTPGSGIRDG